PAGFTKATNIQSALITTDNLYATQVGSNIVLNYAGDGSMIPSQTFETVTFMAYDAIAVESSYVWTSEVDNLSPAVNYRPASVYGAQSQTVNSVIPGFVARGFINPTNAVSTETNRHSFNVIIENVGQTGNNIDMADIYLPTSAFTTNGVIVSSSIINATNISVIASNIIRLDYLAEGRSITPLSSDTINIQIYDTMTTGTQTVAWDMKTKFNTSPGFADTSITPGQSKKVHMIMPDVSAEGELITGSIAFSDTNTSRNFTYQVRNTGTGNNNIYYAEITLPSTFTNCTVNALSSVIANDAANIEELIVNGTNWVIRLKYENESYLTSGQTDDVTVTLNNFLFPTEVFGLRFKCEARNRASTPPPLTSVDVGEKLNIVNPSPWQCDAYLEQDSQFIYTLDKSADLSFRIDNKSGIHGIKKAVIAFDTNIFTNVRVTSRLVSGASISTTLTNIVLDYAGGVFTKVGTGQNYYDVLKIKFNYNLSMPTSRTLACRITFEDNYEFNAPAGSETQVLGVQYAYWGKIVGLIKPNENVNLNIYPAGQSKGTTNYLGQTAFLSTVQSSSDAAIYSIDRLPPGNYDVECQKTGFRNDRYLVNIAVASNRITYADLIILKNNKIEANSTIERQIYCYDDGGNSYVSFAVGSVLEDFYLDIYKKAISDAQVAAISKNSSIINPTAGPDMKVFDFELQNIKAADADEMELDKSVTLVLYYSDAELAAQGWSEDSLAIYYWKHSTGEWIRLGGEIDKAKNTVTVKVAYLHTTYALFGATPVNYTKIFGDLKAWPLAFSPGRGGDTFGKFKVTFIFKSPVDEYRFKVYDLMGRVIYEKIFNSGPYYQGEAPWSGKDNEGVISKSGVYIYQIEVGQEYYRGKVMILK
ncbi:MAG: hypothetical protein KKH98_02830, partial [Spirochaetes bacterium]|nr:hypothetical protein [Spirochaetota bacterium]